MRDLGIFIDKSSKNLGMQFNQELRKLIKSGKLSAGESLPSMRLLAEQLGVHRHTIRVALEELISEGWLEAIPRKGYFVASNIPTEYFEAKVSAEKKKTSLFRFEVHSNIQMPDYAPLNKIKYNFQSGLPDLRLVPTNEIKTFIADALKYGRRDILDYGDTLGSKKLRGKLQEYFRRMRGIDNKEVAITNGSQEGLYLISQLLINQGDSIIMENIGYMPAYTTFKNAGANVELINMDTDGINVDQFEKLLKKKKIKGIFLTPLHQFPTTKVLSVAKRYKIYELCQKHNVFIIEDDYDHEFHFKPPIHPIAADDPSNLVIYLSTFSKSIYPSSRMGFIALPPQLLKPFQQYKRITTHQNDGVMQEALFQWMDSGGLEKHLRKMRRIYQRRRDIMICELLKIKSKNRTLSWEEPQGGMALWLNLNKDSSQFARQAENKGVFVHPEESYRLDMKPGTHLRLGYSNQNEDEIQAGLSLLWK